MGGLDLDLLVVGSGVAGLSVAVRAASVDPSLRLGVLTKGLLEESATRWAQGGVAAVLGEDDDSVDLHLADTLAAGAGLCDVDAVRALVSEGPTRVQELIGLGAVFDTGAGGQLLLAREAGHSLPRVVHAGGAATGVEIERALVAAVRATAGVVLEHWLAVELVVERGRCCGVRALDASGQYQEVRSRVVVLATGGAGQLFSVTTNPHQATGDGVAAALRAGVAVADVEFMQFHPTAMHHPAMPRPLLSEALRGHGALVRDVRGRRFVDELAPRDVVSRAITGRMLETGADHCFLDATGLEAFDERFPTLASAIRAVGLDPKRDWLPIAPAAHYLSGGVVTDLDGASSLPGLWACGEVACTGVHGANRLASNSLLEGMVFAARVVAGVCRGKDGPEPTGAMRAVFDTALAVDEGAKAVGSEHPSSPGGIPGRRLRWPCPLPASGSVVSRAAPEAQELAKAREELQRVMTAEAGVLRSAESLARAESILRPKTAEIPSARHASTKDQLAAYELASLRTVGLALVTAAMAREESRGAHTRTDFPSRDDAFRVRFVLR